MFSSLPNYKREALEVRIRELEQEYRVTMEQLGQTLHASDQLRLERKAADLERKIEGLRNQLSGKSPFETNQVYPEHPPRSRLFGREDETEQILQFLNEDNLEQGYSFVTVCGISGIGKTVLASRIFESFSQSKWVPMEDTQDWNSCCVKIAKALFGEDKPISAIVDFLKTEAVWLFFDGMDLLIEEPQLKAFLRRLAPGDKGKVIITSRGPLNLPAELIIELSPLPLEYAIELFIDCWKPDNVNLSSAQQTDIRVICGEQLLDGHPFSIELIGQSARKRKAFNLRSIVSRLKYEMQQGKTDISMLEELVNDLLGFLPEEEKRLLQRLALMPGDFDQEMIEMLADIHPSIDGWKSLTGLINARLLNVSQQMDGTASYQLHSVVKAIGQRLAQELPEFKLLQRTVGLHLVQSNIPTDWRSGLLNLFEAEEWEEILSVFRQKYGMSFINEQLFIEANSEPQLQTRACYALAYTFDQLGNIALAMEYAETGEKLLKDEWEPTSVGYMSLLLRFWAIRGRSFSLRREHEKGKRLVDIAFSVIQELGSKQKAHLQWEIGQMYLFKGINLDDSKEAENAYRKALAIYSELRDVGQRLKAQSNLATELVKQGRIQESVSINQEILDNLEMTSNLSSSFFPWIESLLESEYVNIVDALTKLREFEEAETYANPGLVYCEERGLIKGRTVMLINTGILEIERGNYEQAQKRLLSALEFARDLGYSEYESEIHSYLAESYFKQGKLREAQESLKYALTSQDPYDQSIALRVAGTMYMAQKQYELAEQRLLESKNVSQNNGFTYFKARAGLELARFYRLLNAQDNMEQELLEAEIYFSQINVPYYLDEIAQLRISN